MPVLGETLGDIAEAFASRVEELQELVLLRGVDGADFASCATVLGDHC